MRTFFNRAFGMVFSSLILISSPAWPQERGIINNQRSPHSLLRSVNIGDVQLTGGFWAKKFDIIKNVTIPEQWRYFNGDIGHHWINFKIAAGLAEGKWDGSSWHDGDFYKWLEAVATVYHVTRDPQLDRWMDEIIEVIGKAQAPDGYLSTRIQLERMERFQNLHHHELYNMGHLMTAACAHYKATGKTDFMAIATKVGDYLYKTFMTDDPELYPMDFDPSNIMGTVELYRNTGNRRYLELAMRFIENRGKTKVGKTMSETVFHRNASLPGTDEIQDRIPLREETQAVGHAVTATYLYAGAADAFMETGDSTLITALQRIWTDVVTRKIYVHGGVGPLTTGLSIRQDNVHEAFAGPFFLPNRECYSETCANIGNAMWQWRMLNATGSSQYTDIMEQVFFNSGISGLSLEGDAYFYSNVLRRLDSTVPLLRNDRAQRWKDLSSYCCPPQLARTVAQMRGYFYSVAPDELWVHLYGTSEVNTCLPGGETVHLIQSTAYPWEGDITLTVQETPAQAWTLKLRIPGWADGATLTINGKVSDLEVRSGEYLAIHRTWNSGDIIQLELPLRVRLVAANPLVEETRNQAAVMRGPVVYCLESVDLPDSVSIMDIIIPRDHRLQPRHDKDFLGGVTVLEGDALRIQESPWAQQPYNSHTLYTELAGNTPEPFRVRLIPYYAWSNRGLSQMTVWLPMAW